MFLIASTWILTVDDAEHSEALFENVTATFNESVNSVDSFSAENIQTNLLTPYSVQGLNTEAGVYYNELITGEGLKFTDFYAKGAFMGYDYGNSSSSIMGNQLYYAADSILISDISNENIIVDNFYTNFGSAQVNLSSQPSQPDLFGSFFYSSSGLSPPVNAMSVNSLESSSFGNMYLSSGIYGPNIMIETNANGSNAMPMTVLGPGGTSFVYLHSKYLFIEGASEVSATFTFGGAFLFLTSYLHDVLLDSNFEPFPTLNISSNSDFRAQSSTNQIEVTNAGTLISSPNQMVLVATSIEYPNDYYTMFTLTAYDSHILAGGSSLFNTSAYNIGSSAERNDLNIIAGTFLGAGVASVLEPFSARRRRDN